MPSFTVYRRLVSAGSESRPEEGVRRFTLPMDEGSDARSHYWISIHPLDGFEEFQCHPSFNAYLVRWAMLQALYHAAEANPSHGGDSVRVHEHLELEMAAYPEGQDILTLEPYFLKAEHRFGFIADFRFRKHPEVPFSRIVQQRSLSLNAQFRRNANFYLDKSARISDYVKRCRSLLDSIRLPGAEEPLKVSTRFISMAAYELAPRVFRFGGNREGNAQFAGMKEHGPFKQTPHPPRVLFAFLQDHRPAAVRFANALTGLKKLGMYQGFQELFRDDLTVEKGAILLEDFSDSEIGRVLERALADDPPPVTVFILPDREEDRYLRIKSIFANAGLPTQGCTVGVLSSDDELKWSIANLALQVFCKAGGHPWQVRGTPTKGLVLGISQSHKLRPGGGVDRFFAFSVLTDNNGVFRKIRILADDGDHASYIDGLKATLAEELSDAAGEFDRVVIHASFRLKGAEMAAIEATVRATSEAAGASRSFAVFKINEDTRFFGVNPAENSLVPYDASVVPLSYNEYLIWFQGIERERRTVAKAFPGPTHVQKLWGSTDEQTVDPDMLQDLVNLSGANWRGFNARSSPVSVYYCHLVAEMIHDFQERGLPLPSVEDLRPWFL